MISNKEVVVDAEVEDAAAATVLYIPGTRLKKKERSSDPKIPVL